MKVMVAGSSGLIGTAIVRLLADEGHEVLRLVRRAPAADDEAQWDPVAGSIDAQAVSGVDAVIHLGGASIAGQRWTEAYKQEIRDSRIKSTQLISETIAQSDSKPAVFLCASALGYYADRGDEILTENSPKGEGFLADVTEEWEEATLPAREAGVRVCNMRIGVVLSETGELPRSMLTPFRFGLGGKLGNGRQYMSWIHIEDVARAFDFALKTESLSGPVNLAAPNPVTNAEFTKALGRVLSRPTLFKVPGLALRIAMGEMAQFALGSARLYPLKLAQSGFSYRWSDIEPALRDILDR